MAIISTRTVQVSFSGTFQTQGAVVTATNLTAPLQVQPTYSLSSGNNTITVPTGATGVTIVPPPGNAVVITFKGVNGDTGVAIGLVDPFSASLATTVTSFVLNAASTVTVELIWS